MKIKEKILKILEYSQFKNIMLLTGGSFLAQAIAILVQPIATRFYLPSDFGVVAIITSAYSMFAPVLSLHYDLSIVMAKDEHESNALTFLSILIGVIVSTIVSLGICAFHIFKPAAFGEAGNWIYFAIPLVYLSALSNILISYNNRNKQYKLMSGVLAYRAIASNAVKLLGGFLKLGFPALLFSTYMSVISGIRRESKYLRENISKIFATNKEELISLLVKYKRQPLFSAPGVFASNYSYTVLPIFLGALYSASEVGFYSLSMMMLGIPISIIAGNASKVFFSSASTEFSNTGSFYKSFKSTALLLSFISAVGFITLWFIAEPLFKIFFGSEWVRSGSFVKIFVPLYAVRFVVTVITPGLIISGKQFKKLMVQCFFIVEATGAFFLAKVFNWEIELFLTVISLSYMINYLAILVLVFFTSRGKRED